MVPKSLNWRVYGPLAAVVLGLLGAVLGVALYERGLELREVRRQDRAAVVRLIESDVSERNAAMQAALEGVLANRDIQAAFRDRDRDRLLGLAAPFLERLGAFGITQLYFHAPDRTVFLRVHDPERSGDRIDRLTMMEAERTGRPALGLEASLTRGLPALRLVAPWQVGDERIGYVELSEEIGGIVRRIQSTLDLNAFLFVDKRVMQRATWEAEMLAAGRSPVWDRYPEVVLVEGTLPAPPAELDARFAGPTHEDADTVMVARVDGRLQEGEVVPIADVSGREVGEIVFLRDRSRMLGAYRRGLISLLALFTLVGLAAWLTLRGIVVRHFVRPLAELRDVTESAGRGQLVETLLARRTDEMGDLGRAVNRLIAELRSSQEERMRHVVDAAHDAVITADPDGVITEWNRQAEKMFGWSREEALGLTLADTVVPPEARAFHLADLRSWREGGAGLVADRPVEMTARRRDGALFPVEITVTPVQTHEGTTLAAFIRDITERRKAESAIRASEERFRRLVETANVVPWEASSRTTRVTYVGPQAEALLGFPLEAWYEEGFWINHVHPDDRRHALTQLALAAGGVEQGEFEYRMMHREGHPVWVRDIVVAATTDEGPVLRGLRFDVTERRRLEDELLQSRKMEAVGRLAGGIAHDFNNILTAILGYSSLLENTFAVGSPERADVLEIRRAATQAADLIQQLLAFARKQVVRPRVVVIDELVQRLEKMMGRVIGEDVALAMRTEAGDAAVWVDPGRFEQALVNLLFNARDAMPRGGTLKLGTGVVQVDPARAASEGVSPGEFVMVSVADTGVGMDAHTLAHAFEPFFTTKKEGQGTGLGLSTAYGVVRQAGGFLEVESAPGVGSEFRVFLPRATATTVAAATPKPVSLGPGGDETILLTEDEPQVRSLTERTLLRMGYRVLVAENGAEAVALGRAQEGRIHLLLTDVVMPVMGGVQAAEAIKADRPDIRVLFVSGYSEESLFQKGLDEGTNFLGKPFTPDELVRKVREVLDAPVPQRA